MLIATGPTQGAERHAGAVGRWKARPWLARVLRVILVIGPLALSVAFTWLAGRSFPPERVGLGRWPWIAVVFVLANVLLMLLRKASARLVPLVALMKLTLVFPDHAPSRAKATLRKSNSRKLLRNIEEAKARGEDSEETLYGDYLLQLLQEVSEHDRLTRGHSERVRAYAEMLGEELRLGEDDMDKLRWAALLHDVGKLTVPYEVLNKDGRPTEDEWKVLSGHPAAARPLLEPLRPWLGDWIHAADQHHCRWDGGGYPESLAGTDISFAGRLVAVADAYDVMTSARSYKKPLGVELARQELTNCAGSQFDPSMVRAFLNISLGRLQSVGGPLAWLINLTGSAQLPVPVAGTVTAGAWSAGVAAVGLGLAAITGSVPAVGPPPESLAFNQPTIIAYDQAVTVAENASLTVTLHASSPDTSPSVSVGEPRNGTVVVAETAYTRSEQESAGDWYVDATYTPAPGFWGEDEFEFRACATERWCSTGVVTVTVTKTAQIARPDVTPEPIDCAFGSEGTSFSTAEDTAFTSAAVTVGGGSDGAFEGTIVVVDMVAHGSLRINDDGSFTYSPDQDFNGTDQFSCVFDNLDGQVSAINQISIDVVAVADPVETVDDSGIGFTTNEDASFTTGDVTGNDLDPDGVMTGLEIEVTNGPTFGEIANNRDGTFDYVPDENYAGVDEFSYRVVNTDGTVSSDATVTIFIRAVNDVPVAAADQGPGFGAAEDVRLTTQDVTANDVDIEDGAVDAGAVTVITDVANGSLVNNGDGTFDYLANANFNGTDSFVYSVADSQGEASEPATVSLTVSAVDDSPVAVDDAGVGFTTPEDVAITTAVVTENDSDPDGDVAPSSASLNSLPAFGSVFSNNDGRFTYTPNANFNGTDSFSYLLTDPGTAAPSIALVTIEVTSGNDAPVANDDDGAGYQTNEDSGFTTADVTLNDRDLEDNSIDQRTVTVTQGVDHGELTNNGDGTFTYLPDTDFAGVDSFTYVINDSGSLLSNQATVRIEVAPVNDAPIATDDSGTGFETNEDVSFTTRSVISNDEDLEDGSMAPSAITVVAGPARGELDSNGDGTFDYTPDADFAGADTFTYLVRDSEGTASATATVALTVAAVNDAPVAGDDSGLTYSTAEDMVFTTGDVTANDSDIEDGTIDVGTVVVVDDVSNGVLTNNGDGTFSYTPIADFFGADAFTYTVTDSEDLASNTATVTIEVVAVNDAPVATSDAGSGYATAEDTPFTTDDVSANDTDIEDGTIDASTVVVVDDASNGSLSNNGDGTFSYMPNANFFGDDIVTYTVADAEELTSAVGTLIISVAAVNDAPVGIPDAGAGFSTSEDVGFVTADVTANDSDLEDSQLDRSTVTIAGDVSNGVLTNNGDGTFGYVPNADFNGNDIFSYTVTDSGGLVSPVTGVVISVAAVNDAPQGRTSTGTGFATSEDVGFTTGDVTANDFDLEDGTVDGSTVTVVDNVTNGVLANNGDGTFGYVPNADFNGTDSFTYTVADSDGRMSPATTVIITVTAVNDAPVGQPDSGIGYTTAEDTTLTTGNVTANDTDLEDGSVDSASVLTIDTATNGALTNNGDGTFDYEPTANFNGTDSFTYTVADAAGLVSAPVTVTLEVTAGNDPPVAFDDNGVGFATSEDVPFTIADISANDTDLEEAILNPRNVMIATDVTNGVLTNNGDGTFGYAPNENFNGTDSFTYSISDSGLLLSGTATVTIVVDAVNDTPVAEADSGVGFETVEDTPFTTGDVTANDSDVEDGTVDAATATVVGDVSNGVLTNNGDGTFGYVPAVNFFGTDSFTYTVTDADGRDSLAATVTLTITSDNDAPTADPDSGAGFETVEDTPFTTGDVTANDSDVEDGTVDAATATIVGNVSNGVLTNNGDGTFGYVPNENFNGTDSFTYTVADAGGLASAPATVTIALAARNDAPVAQDDNGAGFDTVEDVPFTTAAVTANDADVEDGAIDPGTIVVVTTVVNGALTSNGDGTFDYLPNTDFNGTDSFTYFVTDSDGVDSDTVTVTITIEAGNDAPVALDDGGAGYQAVEDTPFTTDVVTTNDSDTEDGAIVPGTAQLVNNASNGTLVNNGDGTFTYTPNADFNGDATFTYTAADSGGLASAPATVTISVAARNDAPTITDPGEQSGVIGEPFSVQIQASDVEADTLTFVANGLPAGLVMDAAGLITGSPATGTAGTASVVVDVTDDGTPAESAQTTFSIVVEAWGVSDLAGDIAITEVLSYGTQDPTQEFVELYNNTDTAIDLTGWTVTDANLRVDGPENVTIVLPANDNQGTAAILQPGEHAVIWLATDDFLMNPTTGLEFVLADGQRKLGNVGDDIWLLDAQGRIVDYMAFGSGGEVGTPPPASLSLWDDEDQSRLRAPFGRSVSLTPHGLDTNTSRCWEVTGSGNATGRCTGALLTFDADNIAALTTSVGLNNNYFEADAGGPYELIEGETLTLDASGTANNPTSWAWDLDGDGQFTDAFTQMPAIDWATLVTYGIDDDGTYVIGLQVDGGIGMAEATLTVQNIAPELSTTGAPSAESGAPYTLSLAATDPGSETITSWTINWGDGTIDTIAGNPSSVSHTYTQPGFTFGILASATDEDGTYLLNDLFVPSFDGDQVFRFAATTGEFVESLVTTEDPIEAEIGPDGHLYVSGEKSNDIWRYNVDTGTLIDVFVSSGDGGLDFVEGFAFGPDGHLYVASLDNNKVLRFDGDTGDFIDTFVDEDLDDPYDVIFGPDSNLYVNNYEGDSVSRYDGVTGASIDIFVSPSAGGLATPEQMAFGPDGNLYVTSFDSGEILRYDGLTGTFLDAFVSTGSGGLTQPSGLAFGPDGHVYVAAHDSDAILRYDGTTGAFLDSYVAAGAGGLTKPGPMVFLSQQQVLVNG